jgi:acetyl-CoA acetyltransferase
VDNVYVLGTGMTSFGKFSDRTAIDLGSESLLAALDHAAINVADVDAVYASHVYGGMVAGQRVAASCGLAGLPTLNVENACASGTSAVIEAVYAIRSGRYSCVAVVGFEQVSTVKGMLQPAEDDLEGQLGLVFPAWYAMRARLYMEKYGMSRDQLSLVAVKNHHHGSLNPLAQYRNEITVGAVAESREIATPLRLLDCCPKGDGGAAVILGSEDRLRGLRDDRRPVAIRGCGLSSGAPDGEYPGLFEDITSRAAKHAYDEAGISPQDVDFAEVHDCFSIAEGLRVEGLGLCDPGRYFHELSDEGRWMLDGTTPINPSGGLLAKGHPLGATGVAQLHEITTQLQGLANERQVGKADVAVAHTRGGSVPGTEGGSCAVLVCEGA